MSSGALDGLALDGLALADFGRVPAGPYADVKIEQPGTGDDTPSAV